MPRDEEQRPELSTGLHAADLTRWYWLKSELVSLARLLGVPTGGGKTQLTARLVVALGGEPGTAEPSSPARRRRPPPLAPPLTRSTVIPAGQRCSQQLREFFVAELGPGFRFDEPMRAFVADGAGRTLGDAINHWSATRQWEPRKIALQFELNAFLRTWHARNPGLPHSDALAAWHVHRSLPRERHPTS